MHAHLVTGDGIDVVVFVLFMLRTRWRWRNSPDGAGCWRGECLERFVVILRELLQWIRVDVMVPPLL